MNSVCIVLCRGLNRSFSHLAKEKSDRSNIFESKGAIHKWMFQLLYYAPFVSLTAIIAGTVATVFDNKKLTWQRCRLRQCMRHEAMTCLKCEILRLYSIKIPTIYTRVMLKKIILISVKLEQSTSFFFFWNHSVPSRELFIRYLYYWLPAGSLSIVRSRTEAIAAIRPAHHTARACTLANHNGD